MLKRLFLILITGFLAFQSFGQDALFLETPTNGQVISGGDYLNITWESSNVENIKIEYSLDGGANWKLIIDSYAAQAGKYPWLVPAKPTTKGKIRISDIDNISTASVTPGTFVISEPQLTFNMDTTAAIVKGNAFRIGWNSLSVDKINLYYSDNGGSSYSVIRKGFPALASSYTWIVPSLNSNRISIKVESADSAAINAIWENAAVISNVIPVKAKYLGGSFDGHSSSSNTSPKLSLIFPAGNETLASSSVQTIRWSSSNIEYLKVEFSSDSGFTWQLINAAYPAYAKKLEWKVPTNTTLKGKIRLTSVEDDNLKATNEITFKIPLKSIAITESFENLYYPQQPIQISWVNNGVDFISLQYRTRLNAGWKSITKSVSAQLLNYIWIPPADLITDSLYFKVNATDHSVQDSTKKALSIKAVSGTLAKFKGGSFDGFSQSSTLKPSIELLGPISGTKLNGFSSTTISWKTVNTESISIHFSSDSGKTWKEVIKSYSGNALKYSWITPAEPTLNGFLKISSSEDSTINSISGKFSIREGFVELTSDSIFNGGINEIFPISWKQSGVSKVNILIRPKTPGSIWTNVIRSYDASAGSFLWILKKPLSGLHSMKIENVNSSAMSDSIDINFNLLTRLPVVAKYRGGSYDGHSSRSNVSKILVTKPQAGEVLIAGTTYNITWSTVNVSDSVKIEYTTDNGQTWKIISVAVDSKTGTYVWTVPANSNTSKTSSNKKSGSYISSLNECKIRISETGSQDEVIGLSNNTFVISGSNDPSKFGQSIIFDVIPDKLFGDSPFIVKAQASSGLPITYAIQSGPATISGNAITLTGAGKIKVIASQAGNTAFQAAEEIREFKVNDLPQTNITVKTTGESCKTSNNGKIEIRAARALKYIVTINGDGFSKNLSFTDLIEIRDLTAGNYSVCITVEGQSDYRQCFDLVISEPKDLVVYATVNSRELNLILAGADSYYIVVNGNSYTTSQKQFNIPLLKGNNIVSVTSDALCQGVFNKEFIIKEEALIYPNPFDDILKLNLAGAKTTKITITDISGKVLYSGQNREQKDVLEIDLSHLQSGTYILKLMADDYATVHKIIKR